MELRDYLHTHHISLKDFASMCNYSRTLVQLVKQGRKKPGVKLVRVIEQVTNGKVTRYELLKDHKEDIDKV